jgi:hypothetical protein
MNISQIDDDIKNIKNPIIFIFNLISYKSELGDNNLSIILRLFIKYHSNILLEYNIMTIFIDELNDVSLSLNVLINFYKLIGNKMSLIFVLKNWHTIYNKNDFWKLTIIKQIEYLSIIKHKFNSIYDCSYGGTPFHHKLAHIFKDNNFDKNQKSIADAMIHSSRSNSKSTKFKQSLEMRPEPKVGLFVVENF